MTLALSLRSSPSRWSSSRWSPMWSASTGCYRHMPATTEVGNAAVPGPVGGTLRSRVTRRRPSMSINQVSADLWPGGRRARTSRRLHRRPRPPAGHRQACGGLIARGVKAADRAPVANEARVRPHHGEDHLSLRGCIEHPTLPCAETGPAGMLAAPLARSTRRSGSSRPRWRRPGRRTPSGGNALDSTRLQDGWP
jgi:hypothetical protein